MECGETSSYLQLREPPVQSTENAREVACDIEDLVTLQVQVAIEHGYEMLSWAARTLNDLSLRDIMRVIEFYE